MRPSTIYYPIPANRHPDFPLTHSHLFPQVPSNNTKAQSCTKPGCSCSSIYVEHCQIEALGNINIQYKHFQEHRKTFHLHCEKSPIGVSHFSLSHHYKLFLSISLGIQTWFDWLPCLGLFTLNQLCFLYDYIENCFSSVAQEYFISQTL